MTLTEAAWPDADEVVEQLEGEHPVRRELPGGYLDIERALPLLVVHRTRSDDLATPQLLLGQSAALVVDGDQSLSKLQELLRPIVRAQADRFGAFLLLELWPSVDREAGDDLGFKVVVGELDEPPQPAHVLREALEPVRVGRSKARVDITQQEVAPSGLQPLLPAGELREMGCLLLGLEVPPVYRAAEDGPIYPQSLRVFRARLTRALQETFFDFVRVHTNYELEDHRELGRRELVPAGTEIDKSLAAFGAGLDVLLHITPVNTAAAFREFADAHFEVEPSFHYRLLPFDPDLLKRELYQLPIEDVSDPTIASILHEKRLELDRMVTLLVDRDTPAFRFGSLQLYPAVEDSLMAAADTILSKVSPSGDPTEWVTPQEFAQRAEREIDLYRAVAPDMQSSVTLREDMPGIMVSRGRLHLSATTRIARGRVEPLIQHEVGTHIVTYENGLTQPLLLLSAGLPGYEQTQEGLAMLAEYVSGGLGAGRLRLIAARVIAVDMMTHGAGFVEIFRRMHNELELTPEASWSVTMRVLRGGGSSKDAIYLRGLVEVLDHLGSGLPLEPLLVGKIALRHVPLIDELMWRQILAPPRLRPRWLDMDGAYERLQRVRDGISLVDLVEH
jgi:uncharacterized protein (TIGR02421 family)